MALTEQDKQWLSAEIRKVVTGDADPSERTYSLGGMLTTVEKRTGALVETAAEILAAVQPKPATKRT